MDRNILHKTKKKRSGEERGCEVLKTAGYSLILKLKRILYFLYKMNLYSNSHIKKLIPVLKRNVFEIGSLYITLAGLELDMFTRLAIN